MKRILMCIMAMSLSITHICAQGQMKIAIMDFNAGAGVSTNDVSGLSDILINYMFNTGKYNIVERLQLNQVLKEQGFQASTMSSRQIVKIGEVLGVKYILIGTVNNALGDYNIDVRIVSAESGEVVSTAGITKGKDDTLRSMMPKLTDELTSKLFPAHANVPVVGGYLYICPDNPVNVYGRDGYINHRAMLNRNKAYGYSDWRAATPSELIMIDRAVKLGTCPKHIISTDGYGFFGEIYYIGVDSDRYFRLLGKARSGNMNELKLSSDWHYQDAFDDFCNNKQSLWCVFVRTDVSPYK